MFTYNQSKLVHKEFLSVVICSYCNKMSGYVKFQVCSTSKMLFVAIDTCQHAHIITVLSLDISAKINHKTGSGGRPKNHFYKSYIKTLLIFILFNALLNYE
jgi:hypothetical protein